MSSLEQEEPEVAATAVVGIAKLMLAGMVTDEEVRYRVARRRGRQLTLYSTARS